MRVTSLMTLFFFFNDTATTEIYTLSLHDALPISCRKGRRRCSPRTWKRSVLCDMRSEEHTSELQSPCNLVCRLLLEKERERQRPITQTTSPPIHVRTRLPLLNVVACVRLSQEAPSIALFDVFFNDTASTEIYTLSLHAALPICLPENISYKIASAFLHYFLCLKVKCFQNNSVKRCLRVVYQEINDLLIEVHGRSLVRH